MTASLPRYPSLPPRLSEILPVSVSNGNQFMVARPAEASENLRVNPLIDAEPSSGTTKASGGGVLAGTLVYPQDCVGFCCVLPS